MARSCQRATIYQSFFCATVLPIGVFNSLNPLTVWKHRQFLTLHDPFLFHSLRMLAPPFIFYFTHTSVFAWCFVFHFPEGKNFSSLLILFPEYSLILERFSDQISCDSFFFTFTILAFYELLYTWVFMRAAVNNLRWGEQWEGISGNWGGGQVWYQLYGQHAHWDAISGGSGASSQAKCCDEVGARPRGVQGGMV